jgi:poly(3-hydroxyoctanoate) depolymerase
VPAPSPDSRVIRFIDAGGVRLRTSVHGNGPPLLLITGLGASLELGAPFERELTACRVQAVRFDAPGVGESSPYRWPPRMPGIARTVERMLDVLGYDRVHVLGVSLGASSPSNWPTRPRTGSGA